VQKAKLHRPLQLAAAACDAQALEQQQVVPQRPHSTTATQPRQTRALPQKLEARAEEVVRGMAAGAKRTYSLGGTMKFELPTQEVTLSTVRGSCAPRRRLPAASTPPPPRPPGSSASLRG
jgi:hypothetical protein